MPEGGLETACLKRAEKSRKKGLQRESPFSGEDKNHNRGRRDGGKHGKKARNGRGGPGKTPLRFGESNESQKSPSVQEARKTLLGKGTVQKLV